MMHEVLKQHLARVDVRVLAEKVRRFRRLNFRKLTYAEIQSEITSVLCFDDHAVLMPLTGTYPIDTRFYRIRRLSVDDRTFPLRGMRVEADAWNPPAPSKGRLNKDRESLLYTSPMNVGIAIEEMRIPEGEIFSLIVYRAKAPINVAQIGMGHVPDELGNDERHKMELLNDFLEHEFTREVGQGTEHLYQISEIIAKDYYDLPPDFQDAWCYPSVAERGGVNVAFRPDKAREKLELLGVQFGSHKGGMMEIKVAAIGLGPDGVFQYHAVGSKAMTRVFPEIQFTAP